jgi:hypothetical protein
MNEEPLPHPRDYKKDEYAEYYNIMFTWNNFFDFEISKCTFQLKPSFSGIALKHPEFYRFLYLLKMDISG